MIIIKQIKVKAAERIEEFTLVEMIKKRFQRLRPVTVKPVNIRNKLLEE